LSDGGEVGVEFNAFDAQEGMLRGEEDGSAFAGTDVEEDGAVDRGLGVGLLEPVVDEAGEDAGSDAVVGGELFDLGVGALDDGGAGDKAGGVGAVGLVEGVDGGLELFAWHRGRQ